MSREGSHIVSGPRLAQTSPVLVVLLSGILLALVGLIVVLVTHGGAGPSRTDSNSGNPPERIEDRDRFRATAQQGRTYRSHVKAGFTARVEDRDWGIERVAQLAFASEFLMRRHIERNDGERIVEVRHFETARSVKLLCDVEDVTIDLGLPGALLLGALERATPGTSIALQSARPAAEAILGAAAQFVTERQFTRAFAHIDQLEGKTVRITYVNGVGVQSIQPLECALTPSEERFLYDTAVLSDYYIMPDLTIAVGGTWSVDGHYFANFFDPTWKGIPSGQVVIVRDADQHQGNQQLATLRVQSGALQLDATDQQARRVGAFEPRGQLQYSLADSFVRSATLEGNLRVEEVSKDHLLFESRFRTQPRLEIVYTCELQ